MNIERTRQYYAGLSEADFCTCEYCQTYRKRIRAELPRVAALLDSFGVDIAKPFEVLPLYEEENYLVYTGAQYVLMGSAEGFERVEIDGDEVDGAEVAGVVLTVTDSHPAVDVEEECFVIELEKRDLLRLQRIG